MPVLKYKNNTDRIKAYMIQQNNYAKKKWFCELCNQSYSLGNKTNHLNTEKHKNKINMIL
jgi:hypothetical protein